MKGNIRKLLLSIGLLAFSSASGNFISAQEPTPGPTPVATPTAGSIAQKGATDLQNLFDPKQDKDEPTYIKSDSLTLKSEERFFQYSGNVNVKRGEMTLSADFIDGKYNDKNQIEELVARKNVVITKGETTKAKCERAIYNAQTNVITLMENPELEQNGSLLAADAIKVYLDENRSVAEGQVRVKVVSVKGIQTPEQQGGARPEEKKNRPDEKKNK